MARMAIETGRVLLREGYEAAAARDAYMAAYHAAMALVVSRTGNNPKTHKGLHIEFARVSLTEPAIDQAAVASLSQHYRFKAYADYGLGTSITTEVAKEALDVSSELTETIVRLVRPAAP